MKTLLDERVIKLAATCRYDPWKWMDLAWEWGKGPLAGVAKPRKWQDDINDTIAVHLENPETRFQPLQIAVASGHGIGKSAEMGMLANWAMSCYSNARVVITANTMGQLRTKTAPEVGKWFERSITKDWFDMQTEVIKVNTTWRTDFVSWSAHNTEAFAGLHNKNSIILILFDEASKIDDEVWEVAEGALTDEDTVIIWVAFGNPTQNSGRFRECFRRYRTTWKTRHIDSRTVEGINTQHLNNMVENYGEDSDIIKVRVRGQFPSTSMMQWISTDDADAAQKRHLRPDQYNFAPVILGVDPAWTGEDSFEVFLRQGLYSRHLLSVPYNDNDVDMARKIAYLEKEHNAAAVFIDFGYGTGIKSVGDSWGRSWELVNFAGKSVRDDCINKRAEIWWSLRDWLKKGGAIDPKDSVLYQDLIGPETVSRADGAYQLESKKDMKSRGMPSPNRADALALTFASPVVSHTEQEREKHAPQDFADVKYNPIEYGSKNGYCAY